MSAAFVVSVQPYSVHDVLNLRLAIASPSVTLHQLLRIVRLECHQRRREGSPWRQCLLVATRRIWLAFDPDVVRVVLPTGVLQHESYQERDRIRPKRTLHMVHSGLTVRHPAVHYM